MIGQTNKQRLQLYIYLDIDYFLTKTISCSLLNSHVYWDNLWLYPDIEFSIKLKHFSTDLNFWVCLCGSEYYL